jgi:hypothetical protein
VPLTDEEARRRPASNYFEFHVKVAVEEPEIEALRLRCKEFGAHLSRSASNRLPDRRAQHFATLRVFQLGRVVAEPYFDLFLQTLTADGYELSNVLREYTVHDTNIQLEAGWYTTPASPEAIHARLAAARGERP